MSGHARPSRIKSKLCWAVFFILCGIPAISFAEEAPTTDTKPWTWALGAKGGAFLGGEVYVEPFYADANAGPMLGLFADSIVVPGFSVGAFMNFVSTGIDSASASLLNMGVSMKARFPVGEVSVRPGLTLGYQQIFSDLETVTGFNPGMVFEVGIPASETTGVLFDVGFFSQPVGGNEAAEVEFGPIFYFAAGVEFGG